MSRQRPYGSMMEAYILLLLTYDRQVFEDFLNDCRGFQELGDLGNTERMRLPATYIIPNPIYIPFWQCLCRMYGEIFANASESYVCTSNLHMLIYDLECCYNRVKDETILIHDPDFKY